MPEFRDIAEGLIRRTKAVGKTIALVAEIVGLFFNFCIYIIEGPNPVQVFGEIVQNLINNRTEPRLVFLMPIYIRTQIRHILNDLQGEWSKEEDPDPETDDNGKNYISFMKYLK
ncbi:unnamed protein product [Adineta steineri]|uniref:Uncharacterized protein n=1 Tax=Adineta steineri TaxID=433720 RepID=A0A813TDM5_9BILA|nr:unnamed protein product [Adineta steineri]